MPVMGGDTAGLVVVLLGPVGIGQAGEALTPVPQPRLRVLLGVADGRMVTTESLVGGVWGRSGRRSARRTCTRWYTSCGGGRP
jgi:hypothetical protein